VYLFVNDLAIQNLERIQVNALVEGEDGVADSRIVGQAEVFL
jgi:hypothetical protein